MRGNGMTTNQTMTNTGDSRSAATSELSTKDLLRRIVSESGELVRKEIDLAKAELHANLHGTLVMAKGLIAAGVLALIGVTLLLVAAIFGLATVMPAWGAALLVAGVVLAAAFVAFAIGWKNRLQRPLERTRGQIKEDVQWAKNRLTTT